MANLYEHQQIAKCYDRLNKAREALFCCRSAQTMEDLQSHWASFLIHTGSILNALDAGSKNNAQARQWYGGKKREGRADSLVSYMHQSRNAEEHDVEPVTTNRPFLPLGVIDEDTKEIDFDMGTDWGSGIPTEDGYIKYRRDPKYKPNPRGKMIIGAAPSQARLRPVTDQFKKIYWPPREHLARPLFDQRPIRVGELYLNYLERLVGEASSLS
ncbi:hypothetical protein [Roseococcus thiosulfatophilus]|uniref:hypothetical protein n=1 Tax=Roseococcus thiosulfatophilus TaxID=35813 RepID=UPI001A8CA8AA|nr:hypothetical protein [Roseococcus thiosulfatophilus]